jgi:hypothetical protein
LRTGNTCQHSGDHIKQPLSFFFVCLPMLRMEHRTSSQCSATAASPQPQLPPSLVQSKSAREFSPSSWPWWSPAKHGLRASPTPQASATRGRSKGSVCSSQVRKVRHRGVRCPAWPKDTQLASVGIHTWANHLTRLCRRARPAGIVQSTPSSMAYQLLFCLSIF